MIALEACPDDGTCHHGCKKDNCFRVGHCGPLSDVFSNNQWPEIYTFETKTHINWLAIQALKG